MRLIAELERRMAEEASPFRRQLLKEDLARLEKLRALAAAGSTRENFLKEGARVEWTAGDLRTHEFQATLTPFLEMFYACATEGELSTRDQALRDAWVALEADRIEKLIGCLATRPRM